MELRALTTGAAWVVVVMVVVRGLTVVLLDLDMGRISKSTHLHNQK